MPITADLLTRKQTHFVLWLPHGQPANPSLVIGQFAPGNPPDLAGERTIAMTAVAGRPDLWELAASACGLQSGQVYHYWFELQTTHPDRQPPGRIRCTDPTAFTVDWRLVGPALPAPFRNPDDRQPASVIQFQAPGSLVPCDPGGERPDFGGEGALDQLPPNNRLVIYEMPTAWTRRSTEGVIERGVGTFRDVRALVDANASGANFDDLEVTAIGRSYLRELGVNALELLPPADSAYVREWGYGTSHFFAPDHELGFPASNASPTAGSDLAALVGACHRNGVRFFVDMVMAFAKDEAYQHADFDSFYIDIPDWNNPPDDPDAFTSGRAGGRRLVRNGFGSVLFRYARTRQTYDPVSGIPRQLSPARQLMLTALARWARDFHIDGVRMDSVENVANWDVVQDIKDQGRRHLNTRWADDGVAGSADSRYLTIGEELELPPELFSQNRIDALWNDRFRARVRAAVLGEGLDGMSFKETVRQLIECVRVGFSDGGRAINYITSHDVEDPRKERLFNMLRSQSDTNKRIQLAFTCLLTAVGIPMILAGEEFADEHDLFDANGNVSQNGGKQVDPVNFSRLGDAWRRDIFRYVARLVHLRTTHPALSVNDTNFIHVDFEQGKRVLVWRRGNPADPVVVVANFSSFATDTNVPNPEYRVPNWPATPPNRRWVCVSQGDRVVPPSWVAREPIFGWEAKVYALA